MGFLFRFSHFKMSIYHGILPNDYFDFMSLFMTVVVNQSHDCSTMATTLSQLAPVS